MLRRRLGKFVELVFVWFRATAKVGGFFNVCLAQLKISAFFLTTCFFHSINLSAGQKELAYTPDLFWFDALFSAKIETPSRCFNFSRKKESFTQVKENSFLKYMLEKTSCA